MASVRKRKWTHNGVTNEAWVVQYTKPNGKTGIKTFRKKKDADAFRDNEAVQIESGERVADRDSVTMKFAAESWLEECEKRNRLGALSGYTLGSYKYQVASNIVGHIGGMRLSMIERHHLQDLVNELGGRLKRRSIENTIAIINHIFRFATRRKWLAKSPIVDDPLLLPGKAPGKIPIPGKEDIRRILEVLARGRQNGMQWHSHSIRVCSIMLALFAGMRRGEICGLKWSNVDFQNEIIRVRHSYSRFGLKEPKTDAGHRDIPMAPPLKAALLQARASRTSQDDSFVILSRVNTPIEPETLYTRYWRPVMKEAGLCDESGTPRYHFHALRHAAVSLLIEQGLPAIHISRFVGHSKVSTTLDIYGHIFPGDQASRLAVARLEAQLGATTERQEILSP